jgi:hypothetical protein
MGRAPTQVGSNCLLTTHSGCCANVRFRPLQTRRPSAAHGCFATGRQRNSGGKRHLAAAVDAWRWLQGLSTLRGGALFSLAANHSSESAAIRRSALALPHPQCPLSTLSRHSSRGSAFDPLRTLEWHGKTHSHALQASPLRYRSSSRRSGINCGGGKAGGMPRSGRSVSSECGNRATHSRRNNSRPPISGYIGTLRVARWSRQPTPGKMGGNVRTARRSS